MILSANIIITEYLLYWYTNNHSINPEIDSASTIALGLNNTGSKLLKQQQFEFFSRYFNFGPQGKK